jgi:ribonuclease VapC
VIVVDTSALLAVLLDEPEKASFRDLLASDVHKMVSAVNVLEAGIVMSVRRGPDGLAALSELLGTAEIEVVPFDQGQSDLALRAFRAFGKGRHTARLNICDCAAYALAKRMNAPLLYKSNDFTATDVAVLIG